MNISKKGIELIKKWEGLRLKAYKCPANVWTIGYGHTKNVVEGMTISETQAEQFLLSDLAVSEKAVNSLPYKLTQNQYDALVSFTFNCGVSNLDKLTANNSRTLDTIAEKMLLYNKANGKTLQGLINRRKDEYELFKSVDISYSNINSIITSIESLRDDFINNLNTLIEELKGVR